MSIGQDDHQISGDSIPIGCEASHLEARLQADALYLLAKFVLLYIPPFFWGGGQNPTNELVLSHGLMGW